MRSLKAARRRLREKRSDEDEERLVNGRRGSRSGHGSNHGAGPADCLAEAVYIGDNDLGGLATSANGPEAGVWVIAETTGLPTKFAKVVDTDDRGRYMIPDLPKANYNVWCLAMGSLIRPRCNPRPANS